MLKEIIEIIDEKIPKKLALDFDTVGFKTDYDLNQEINSIKIFMDLIPEYDTFGSNVLIITHHPPLFIPKTPTYTIHSNWDIIDGGANESLAEILDLEIIDYFDDKTKIGRICKSHHTIKQLKEQIQTKFEHARIVNEPPKNKELGNIGIISGFGLKNPDYIKLAKEKNLELLISGDLCQETAILALNLDIILIDLGHHESEVPGLYKLATLFKDIDVNIEVIDKKPIENI